MSDESNKQHETPAGGEPQEEKGSAGEGQAAEEGGKKKGGKKKAAKKAPKGEKKPKAPKEKKSREGVIHEILQCLQQDGGASHKEIMAHLKKKFPDRGDGMATTVRIQMSRLPARLGFELKKTKDEKRGLVYKAPKSARLDKPVEKK